MLQIKTFTVPIHDDGSFAEELNRFLRSRQVLEVDREFVQDGSRSCWCFCVRYLERSGSGTKSANKKRIDYKEVLDETTFATFAALRSRRKDIAQAEGIPAFAVFTDAQLADMARLDPLTPATIAEVKGVGTGKIERYAEKLLEDAEASKGDAGDGDKREDGP